ncbi:filamentous haemagglutinin family protein [Pseudomonas sp. CCC3.1]|uniref:filamentous haemagglutinin family protein n=3 Tax=unclassified Pseudomonas TaxID=196821 RepID=UPI002AC944E5|nr:filamentous haemagglutinin family protein [Pseudomonas sp. CCC3.1]MEB0207189.1 filamentous hemagglutinin family protein [Pseudomonas sp. CCC3.1]WPX38998.1 filamentous hemagglutinin family protein [Pseudomonas sp. CCC3.1]
MVRCKAPINSKAQGPGGPSILRLKPLAHAIALLMVAGSAHGATAFSSGWFADKGASQAATAARNNAQMPKIPSLNQQAKVNQQLQRSLTTLNTTVAAIAAQQAAQAAGRQAASGQVSNIPDGLGKGGLQVDNSLTQGWTNAKSPTQTQAGGKTTVTIEQTADKAILNWETFNVGRNTTVDFQQQSNWAALNRVNDPNAKPSEIQGQIKGAGTVMIMNRNGVVFSGTSQVNVRNLVAGAANITDDQFTQRGIYVDVDGSSPTFTDAAGKVEVQRGAVIQTHAATLSTESGGYALLLGSEVENAGTVITPKGQTTLAAGDSFYIRRGVGTSGNQNSTTRGNEVATSLEAGSTAGAVSNNGLIMASTGDVTLTGRKVEQNGVALASTSVDSRGTVHLLNSVTDSTGTVTLGKGSTTAILLDGTDATALNSQRDNGLLNLDGRPNPVNNATGLFDNLSTISDRIDQSRIDIVSGGTVEFKDGSTTLATGGQVAVTAGQRSLVRDGAMIDVSGAVGVKVSMESNSIKINIQGNEQRDAPVNRDGGKLINYDVWVDLRELVFVPAGTNGYATDRWYTAGGLLEVGGYLGTQGHSVGEWMAQGGTLTFTGNEVVSEKNAQFNLSGGTVDVQSGLIRQTWLKGPDGRLYELSKAPGDILYSGIYKGFEDTNARWGRTDFYYNPLIAPKSRNEAGYTVGRDAGKLVIGTSSAVLEGQLISDVFQGERQVKTPTINTDGYQQTPKAAAQRAQLIIGNYTPVFNKSTGTLRYSLNPVTNEIVFESNAQKIADGLNLDTALPTDRQGKVVLDSDQINGVELGAIKTSANQQITVNGALKVADGGDITLFTPQATINANLTAHAGSINAGNLFLQPDREREMAVGDVYLQPTNEAPAWVKLASGVNVDTTGRWNNLAQDGVNNSGAAYMNGGNVSLRTTGDLNLAQGSVIDVSSGATVGLDAKFIGGKGGSVTLAAMDTLELGSELRAYGVTGGGKLAVQARKVQIGDSATAPDADTLHVSADFFKKGFSAYDITGNEGLLITDGTQVDVTMPVYRQGERASTSPTGIDPASVLERWTPSLYQENALKGVLTQRRGASLNLNAGTTIASGALAETTALTVGKGAVVNVDPGQAINLRSIGQLTVDGTLNAWGGSVSLAGLSNSESSAVDGIGHGRSIWIGGQAVIDVASRAVTAVDNLGRVYGQARNGGQIIVGGDVDPGTGIAKASDLFVVVREGARLDASGSQALLDIPGQGRVNVASNGGNIAFASNNGLYLDGLFKANAGGEGAAGGRLSLALEAPYYLKEHVTDRVLPVRELVLSQQHKTLSVPDSAEAAADSLIYGHGALGVDQVKSGGFDNMTLLVRGVFNVDGDISLNLGQSLHLYTGGINLTRNANPTSRVNLSAPHVVLSGMLEPDKSGMEAWTRPYIADTSPGLRSQGTLVVDSGLLDIRDRVGFGDTLSFDNVQLNSSGDLRFLAGRDGGDTSSGFSTQLRAAGDLTLRAARIYPGSDIKAQVLVGNIGVTDNRVVFDPTRTLTIEKVGDDHGVAPDSVFGRLQLGAYTIKQGGVLRAPLGLIELGNVGNSRVELLPGSLTSVSAKGLVLPYGGTVDGQVYRYNGKNVVFVGQGGLGQTGSGELTIGVILGGTKATVLPGATLDLSGGGELLGAGFISGRGGSTDARFNPLVQFGATGGFSLPGLGTNPIYAIVPGVQSGYAPATGEAGASTPLVGQQITLGAGVPGLPAGTYTLMPSTYALKAGAFRVEINDFSGQGSDSATTLMRNGSWSTAGQLSIINTGIHNSVNSQVILTSGDTLRRYSQYNETSYAQFAIADAAKLGVPRPMLEVDAKTLKLAFGGGAGKETFTFEGIGQFEAAKGGYGGTVGVINLGGETVENWYTQIVDANSPLEAFEGLTLTAQSLNNLNAKRIFIGGLPQVEYGRNGNIVKFPFGVNTPGNSVFLRSGATLSAPEVVIVAGPGNIVVEQGASITTLGRGAAIYDARDGFIYEGVPSLLAVSNGLLNVLPYLNLNNEPTGNIQIGVCPNSNCSGQTTIYSEGSIVAATDKALQLDDAVRYGTRHLTLALSNINVGSTAGLADAAARNVLPSGLTLNQQVLERLMRGDTSTGAPALETLQLSAGQAFNFYGTTLLDTYDAQTGKSLLNNLVLSAPAIYGLGNADDVATIHTANLIWQGATGSPGAVITDGAGTGSGRLDINAERIEFGYGPFAQPSNNTVFDRLVLGFANVNLNASDRITANYKGSLSVYQRQGAYDPVTGFAYSGGNLNIVTPLMTGEGGSLNRITAGGAIDVSASAGPRGTVNGYGGELSFKGDTIRLASVVVLPSGKVTLDATGDVVLTDESLIDVAGRAVVFNDITKYGAGGDVLLDSRHGNIHQALGSTIDVSAQHNQGGKLRAVALDAAGGMVDLQGKILGGNSGYYNAGGTLVPYQGSSVEVQAQRLGATGALDQQFAALNQRLNDGEVFGARSFQLKQGDLTIGNGLKANIINVSVDNGSLRVAGLVDASGERVGSINLAGKKGLTLDSSAVLDAHGSQVRVDSYGKIIDSPNRAMVVLGSGTGQLNLADGVRIDLRHGTAGTPGNDGRNRGTLEMNAPRLNNNDIAIDASGRLDIQGARAITLNGMATYDDAPVMTDPTASGRPYQVIDQAYLDGKHVLSTAFINAALQNSNLLNNKLAGLNNATYADTFHLRPGVEIVSKTPNGDLVVQGDVDLSGYRYASLNRNSQKTSVYGSGEPGSLTLRAGGDLSIYGSINDGFAPPPPTVDDNGWVLLKGRDFSSGGTIVPGNGVVLADGTTYMAGSVLNYDLPIKGTTVVAGTRLPVRATLAQEVTLPADTVLAAAVLDASGNTLLAAGTLLNQPVTLQAGTQLEAGTLLGQPIELLAMLWPKGVPLPALYQALDPSRNVVTLDGNITLARGSLIPTGTDVKLVGNVDSIKLRPEVAGRQGKNWAISPMLAEGSQSWSLRLVAGADTEAADSRLLQPHPSSGTLRLADSHFGMFAKLLPPKGVLVWSAYAVEDLGNAGVEVKEGDPVDQSILDQFELGTIADFCTNFSDYCQAKMMYVWTSYAAGILQRRGIIVEVGSVVEDQILEALGVRGGASKFCVATPSYCVSMSPKEYAPLPTSSRFSVVRTGTGDLQLLSGGNLSVDSSYGVYTAGTSSTGTYSDDPFNQPRALKGGSTVLKEKPSYFEQFVNGGSESLYRAWYPEAGGNLTLNVNGNLTGNLDNGGSYSQFRPNSDDSGNNTADVGNWLWRQGSGDIETGGKAQPTAWWINFGTYTNIISDNLIGFTGFGTLGGGDLDVTVGGDAGSLKEPTFTIDGNNKRTQGLVLAVGSTGRVSSDGSLQLTGGGDLRLQVRGALNPVSIIETAGNRDGVLTNTRGNVHVQAASIGRVDTLYGTTAQVPGDVRAADPLRASRSRPQGGVTLVAGDATFSLHTLGDLVVQTVEDAGRVRQYNQSAFSRNDVTGGSSSWFTLWTPNTAVDLYAEGGNLTPFLSGTNTDLAVVYPSILRATAASGSFYYGKAATSRDYDSYSYPILLAPGKNGQLQFLAQDSIYAGGFSVTQSGTALSSMATPWNPAFLATLGWQNYSNLSQTGNYNTYGNLGLSLFTFGPGTTSEPLSNTADPSRFYAVQGDLIGVNSGRIIAYRNANVAHAGETWYEGSRPVWMMAGRDIVSSGANPGDNGEIYPEVFTTGNLFVHNNATDISIVSAGRDIIYSSFNIAGPGGLEITAGRSIVMDDKVSVTSIGPIVAGDLRQGASIAMQAGTGANGADYQRFIEAYLNPANQLAQGEPLSASGGKVAKTYEKELLAWLSERFGFVGDSEQAVAYFKQLPGEQQRVFARDVYFAELEAGGREYNQAGGVREGSYARGRAAIAALFPEKDVAGNAITYLGDIRMFGGAGVHTDFGGSIQMLTPGGSQTFGIEGVAPPASAGVITQGAGNIQLYSLGSILLGQSRIMTTFGGSIMGWSAAGDINAGRGSKTTVVYTPPKRTYDNWGNVALSPSVPSTGAGIATLNPIPEVPAGDIDLIAPLGTIDAGEAGIRVSGNINIAALRIVNAANIQTQGKSSGVPVAASVNTGALSSASSAGAAASQAADSAARNQQAAARQGRASIVTVEVLSFGSEPVQHGPEQTQAVPGYNPNSPVQVLGAGRLSDQARASLTEEERGQISL